ncbi:PAS domain-containing protein [Azospirillum fermentarium]|uniref:helix-turn-helix transcriptional regulator n=1 Tax=Azospirillum fermentarium TaxID=1233114 RepID=UPI0022270E11|nr:hypothetical protein [Azospirillum fermentarium]MCW2246344.1 PAS domain-containing protein [Azospirillum fermentarium]
MSLPLAVAELPSPAIELVRATDEAGGTIVVFDASDHIVWANEAQRTLMPCNSYGSEETYESLFWSILRSGKVGNKAAFDDPHSWLAKAVAARQCSSNLNFVNVYPWGRMIVSLLRLEDGRSIQSRIDYKTSGIARLFPDFDGGVGVLWALKMQQRMRSLQTALDALSVAVGLVDARGCVLHRNASLADLLAVGDGLGVDEGGVVVATDECDGIVLAQALENVSRGAIPHQFVPLRRRNGSPLMMAVSRGDSVGTAVIAVSRFGEDQAELAATIRQALNITPAEAEVISGIGTGMSVSEIAAARGVTEDTAYKQIKSVRNAMRRSRFAANDLAGIASLVTKIAAISRPYRKYSH